MSITTAQLLNGEVRLRRDAYRMDLLDLTGAVIGVLAYNEDQPPQITWDATGRLQRTMRSLVLPPGVANEVDTVSMAVRPMMLLQDGTEWPLGIFRWADENQLENSWGSDLATSLVDRSTILDQEMSRAVGAWPQWNPVSVAIDLAQEVLPPEQVAWTGISIGLAAPMSWQPGARRIQVMTDLLAQAGYVPPYFDRYGICQLRPAPDPTLGDAAVVWGDGYPVEAGSRSRTNTLLDTPNEFVVYDSSGQGNGLIGRYVVPDSAPYSEARRGFPVPRTKSVSGLPSQRHADGQAYALYLSEGNVYEYQQFTSAPNPLHDAWTVVQWQGEPWLETRWSLTCVNGGLMTHTLRRVYGQDQTI